MLSLRFEGWFQCRLPTNPDPTDEPRGISGSTWALAGEPDLDRIIRWSDPVAPRSYSPAVGVHIVSVSIDGAPRPKHPLQGSAVDLLGEPKFEERNGIIAKMGEAPIDPFYIEVSSKNITLRRRDLWDPRRPALRIHEVPPDMLRRRQPTHTGRGIWELASAEVADATGVADFPGYFQRRRELLQKDLEVADDPIVKLALRTRIRRIDRARPLEHFRLGFRIEYQFEINGPTEIVGNEADLGGTVLRSPYWLPSWPIRFWMGGYDSDTLCAFLRGTLDIPFRASTSQSLSGEGA
jgi:hypothetical protein